MSAFCIYLVLGYGGRTFIMIADHEVIVLSELACAILFVNRPCSCIDSHFLLLAYEAKVS